MSAVACVVCGKPATGKEERYFCSRAHQQVAHADGDERKEQCRKLFTDHAVYTARALNALHASWVLGDLTSSYEATALSARLTRNQEEIGAFVGSAVLGIELRKHINIAINLVTVAFGGEGNFAKTKEAFERNGNAVARELTRVTGIPYETGTQPMFAQHNAHLVSMTVARKERNHSREIELFDAYYAHILQMADAISSSFH